MGQLIRRPKKTWRRLIEEEVKTAETTRGAVKKAAQTRVRWGAVAEVLCSTWNPEEQVKSWAS